MTKHKLITLSTTALTGIFFSFSPLMIHSSWAENTHKTSKTIIKISTVKTQINTLKKLMKTAHSKGFDIEREKGVIWMAEQFLIYANYDENHLADNTKLFKEAPMYKDLDYKTMAKNLPNYERSEVLAMVKSSIKTLNDVIAQRIVRKPVEKIDWKNISVKNGQFRNPNNKPVFLFDYFSKAMGAPKDDKNLYNDYLGDIASPLSMSLSLAKTEKGGLVNTGSHKADDIVKYYEKYPTKKDNIGYWMLWHSGGVIPPWAEKKYGMKNLTHGQSIFTRYDIDNPVIRNTWTHVFKELLPQTGNQNYKKLGYILANEPHWYTDKDSWFKIKTSLSHYTMEKFRVWLKQKHHNSISELNKLWKTSYKNFDEITIKTPLDVKNLRGTPKLYDWSRFNMYRVTNWFTFLHDGIKKNDSQANTSIKIMPRVFTDENGSRDHGLDVEALTDLTEFNGNDTTIRTKLYYTKNESWQKKYAYSWREVAMTRDLFSSFSPNKISFNSESHFISGSSYRNKTMKKSYVRSAYWLATILGMNANLTWYWARFGDGSIEPRILKIKSLGAGYPGSVAQMPQVANEIFQTITDLNATSEDIVKFQRQEKPIRLFYSETSNINYKDQINKLFNVYESMYFDGIPIGFATKNILNKHIGKFNETVIYKTPSVTDDEFKAIQDYLNNGGMVIMDQESLKFNEYLQPRHKTLSQGKGKLIVLKNNSLTNFHKIAFNSLSKNDIPKIHIIEKNSSHTGSKGAIWRVVQGNNAHNHLVTIINVGKTTANLTITDPTNKHTHIVNILTGKQLPATLNLKPEGTLLLNIGTKTPWVK